MEMPVLFITRKWAPAVGGMETYSYELSRNLSQLCSLKIHCLPGQKSGKPPSILSLLGFMFSSAFRVLRESRLSVVHVGDLVLWPLILISRLKHPSAKVVVTAYGLDIIYGKHKGLLPKIYNLYLNLGVRLTGKYVHVIAISRATANLCSEVGFSNVSVVNLGVSTPKRALPELRQDRDKYVLFVGRLVKRKGAVWFANNVLPLLPNDVKMKVVGKCWDKEEIKALLNHDRVEYLGMVSNFELTALRREAVAVLMPNITTNGIDIEGFGLTALEAVADGGILIASGIEGIVDAVVDGLTGFLLPPEKHLIWKEKINEILAWPDSEREAFVRNAREVVDKRYSWERVAQETVKVYQ